MTWTREKANAAAVRFLGEGFRLLAEEDTLQEGDETGRMSLMLSLDHYEGWLPVAEGFGQTIAAWITPDADRSERVFRRRIR